MTTVAFWSHHGHAIDHAAALDTHVAAAEHGLFRERAAAVNIDIGLVGGVSWIGHGEEP